MEIKGAIINKAQLIAQRLGSSDNISQISKSIENTIEKGNDEKETITFPSGMKIKTLLKDGTHYVTHGELNMTLIDAMNRKHKEDIDFLVNVMSNVTERKIGGVYMVLFDTDSDSIQKAYDAIFEKGGKRVPIGTRVTRKSGVVEEKTADGWKVVPKNQRTSQELEATPRSSKDDDDVIVVDEDEAFTEVTSEDRWKMYESSLWATLKGRTKCTFAFGSGGVGKTYTLFGENMLVDKLEMRMFDDDLHEPGGDDYDVVKISGKNTTTDFWRNIYKHNGKTIVFDDCDPVLENDDVLGMLKPILDTSGDGIVEYKEIKVGGASDEKTPARIRFTGRMIFITNIPRERLEGDKRFQPLTQSRALLCDLTMTKDETIRRIRQISEKGMKIEDADGNPLDDVQPQDIDNTIEFLEAHKEMIDIGFFNPRKIGNVVKLIVTSRELGSAPSDWVKQAASEFGLKKIKRSFIESRNIALG